MSMYSSRPPFNDDRHPFRIHGGEARSQRFIASDDIYDPRPEFNREQSHKTNPILAEFRRYCGPEEWDILPEKVGPYADSWVKLIDHEDSNDCATWGALAGLDSRMFAHARKVLSRLSNLSGSDD